MKRFVMLSVFVMSLILFVCAAWAEESFPKEYPGDTAPFRRLIPNQKGYWGNVTWQIDENGVIHAKFPFGEGPHRLVGRIATVTYSDGLINVLDNCPEDQVIFHYVTPLWAPNGVGSFQVYSVDGMPVWKWKQTLSPENKRKVALFESENPHRYKFYKNVETDPGKRKVELWISGHAQKGMWTAVLYTNDTVTPYYLDVQPIMKYDRVYVPVRGVIDKLGAEVAWNEVDETVFLSANGNTILLKPGQDTALVNGRQVKMDVPSELINGRTLLPIRFVAENLGYKVNWEPSDDYTRSQLVIGTP